ncbi:MAG: hypothetical protein P9M13_05720 [Candidatus Ancaeobacter aquaticus]|nr:hypothetical protein [Candidatus Ancaeobacter aquaticus]
MKTKYGLRILILLLFLMFVHFCAYIAVASSIHGESSALRAKLQERQKYLKECEEVEKKIILVRRNGVQFNDWEEWMIPKLTIEEDESWKIPKLAIEGALDAKGNKKMYQYKDEDAKVGSFGFEELVLNYQDARGRLERFIIAAEGPRDEKTGKLIDPYGGGVGEMRRIHDHNIKKLEQAEEMESYYADELPLAKDRAWRAKNRYDELIRGYKHYTNVAHSSGNITVSEMRILIQVYKPFLGESIKLLEKLVENKNNEQILPAWKIYQPLIKEAGKVLHNAQKDEGVYSAAYSNAIKETKNYKKMTDYKDFFLDNLAGRVAIARARMASISEFIEEQKNEIIALNKTLTNAKDKIIALDVEIADIRKREADNILPEVVAVFEGQPYEGPPADTASYPTEVTASVSQSVTAPSGTWKLITELTPKGYKSKMTWIPPADTLANTIAPAPTDDTTAVITTNSPVVEQSDAPTVTSSVAPVAKKSYERVNKEASNGEADRGVQLEASSADTNAAGTKEASSDQLKATAEEAEKRKADKEKVTETYSEKDNVDKSWIGKAKSTTKVVDGIAVLTGDIKYNEDGNKTVYNEKHLKDEQLIKSVTKANIECDKDGKEINWAEVVTEVKDGAPKQSLNIVKDGKSIGDTAGTNTGGKAMEEIKKAVSSGTKMPDAVAKVMTKEKTDDVCHAVIISKEMQAKRVKTSRSEASTGKKLRAREKAIEKGSSAIKLKVGRQRSAQDTAAKNKKARRVRRGIEQSTRKRALMLKKRKDTEGTVRNLGNQGTEELPNVEPNI